MPSGPDIAGPAVLVRPQQQRLLVLHRAPDGQPAGPGQDAVPWAQGQARAQGGE